MSQSSRISSYTRINGPIDILAPVNSQINKIRTEIPKIKRDVTKIIQNNVATKKNLQTSNNTFSLDNVNSLTNSYIYCMKKLNFTLNCINQYSEEIIASNSYAQVLRPIFEKKYTDNATGTDGYIFIDNIIPTKITYFFEADSSQDETTVLTGKYAFLQPLRKVRRENRKKKFDIAQKANPTQQIFYFTDFYNWTDGIKITIFVVIPNVLKAGEWIVIGSGYNLTPKIPKYTTVSLLPSEYKTYLQNIENAFKQFCSSTYNPSNGTIYQFGANFNILKVVSSNEYPYWNDQLIINCYINGSNIDMPNVISQINISLNRNFTGAQEGQIVVLDYLIGDTYYTGIIKFFTVPNYGLCYQIIAINKNEIFLPSVNISGDIDIQGNLNIVNYNNEPIISTDNTRKVTCFHDKVGINQQPFEVKGLMDIDNLTQQTIFDLFEAFQLSSRNSYNIMQVINDLFNPTDPNIQNLFNSGQPLFDYSNNQCSIFRINIKPIISQSDLSITYNLKSGALLSSRTFSIIQTIIKELNQMLPDFLKANDPRFIFSFVELMPDALKKWYIISARGKIVPNPNSPGQYQIIIVLTSLPVTNLMIDSSYTTQLYTIVDYISRVNRSVNLKHLLLKNPELYINGQLNVIDFENLIKNSPYFSNNFDLSSESYLFSVNKITNILYLHGRNEWVGQDCYNCWNGSVNVGEAVTSIEEQLKTLYNDVTDYTVPVVYVWDSKKKISFINFSTINGVGTIIGAGFTLSNLLSQSLIVKGDNKLTGNFFVNDWNDNVIFKVDNVEKTIINAYKVGIGIDKPASMLDVRDTTVQNVIDEINIRVRQMNDMNILTEQLKSASNETTMSSIMTLAPSTFDDHTALFKLNMSTLKSTDTKVVFHPVYPNWNGKTFGQLLIDDPLNNSLIKNAINSQQLFFDNETIFDGAIINTIFNHNAHGYKICGWKFISINGQMYMYACGVTILTRNINYGINVKINLLYETRKCIVRMTSDLYRRKTGKPVLLNLQKGLNTLNTLLRQTQDIKKHIFKISFNKTSITTLSSISVSEIDFDSLSETNMTTVDMLTANEKQKYTNLIVAVLEKFNTEIKPNFYIPVTYSDNTVDFLSSGFCYAVQGNMITLICVEFCIQDVITASLNVEGDTKITGDLLISNQATGTNFVSIDPIQQFVGINTDEREISYRDVDYTTTSSLYNAKFMVHVQGKKYPVMVSERIQENVQDTSMIQNILTATNEEMQQINPRYFGTNSGFTVKRKSNLYNFDEIVKCSNILDTQNKSSRPQDKVTNLRYGSDISFEVCDKTNRTVELIDLQGTVDSITPEGFLKGGFGIKAYDTYFNSDNTTSATRRNIMYVDNSGTLFINKVNLNGVALENIDGKLFWGGKEVVTK